MSGLLRVKASDVHIKPVSWAKTLRPKSQKVSTRNTILETWKGVNEVTFSPLRSYATIVASRTHENHERAKRVQDNHPSHPWTLARPSLHPDYPPNPQTSGLGLLQSRPGQQLPRPPLISSPHLDNRRDA